MSHTFNSITPFLAFLDMHPEREFNVVDGHGCAYAAYLIACGMTRPTVSDDIFRCIDAAGQHIWMKLPPELGRHHCLADHGNSNITYALLASRIRNGIERNKGLHTCTDFQMKKPLSSVYFYGHCAEWDALKMPSMSQQ